MVTVKESAAELKRVVDAFHAKLGLVGESDFSAKPIPGKWSKKEVLGHLIDSAQSNLRRFVSGQYEEGPTIVYDQDFWVKANDYQHIKDNDVIELWRLINERIVTVLQTMEPSAYSRTCNTSKTAPSLHTLEWLAEDYVKHLKHHLNQIFPKSFDIVYP